MFQKLISERKSLYKKYGIAGMSLVIVGLLMVVIRLDVAIAMIVVGAILLAIMSIVLSKRVQEFRKTLLVDVLNQHFSDVKYSHEKGISRHAVSMSELLPKSDRFYSNDLIDAMYEDIRFRMSDVLLQEVRHRDKRTEVVTVFQGPFVQVDFNKTFQGKLIVQEAGKLTLFSQYKRVSMESTTFNKTFNTYATNEHTAFYILTPHMMERLEKMEDERKGKFYFSFINGTLFVALDNRTDNFSINMFGRLDESISARFERELRIVKDLIEELRLNRTIFEKGE